MPTYLANVWRCRYFWLSLVRMDLENRYRRSVLGIGWSLLQPICMAAVVGFVFSNLFQMDARTYGPYLLAGLSFWNFVTCSTSQGCLCLVNGESYIRQYPAPLAIYPLRIVLAAAFHLVLALLVVMVLRWLVRGFDNVAALWTLVPTLCLLLALSWSIGVMLGLANVFFPDSQHLSEIALQILFYATPIIYPVQLLDERGLGWLARLNPLSSYLELVRLPLLEGRIPSLATYGAATATSCFVVAIAVAALARYERRLIFYL